MAVLSIEDGGKRIRLSRAQALRMDEDVETRAYMQDATRKSTAFGMTLGRGAPPQPAEVVRQPEMPPVARRRVSWTRSSWASGRSGGRSPRTAPRNAVSSAS
jgi:hypothetical protein